MNCQPNDLAVTVNTVYPQNNGVIVKVIRRHINTEDWNYGDVPAWWCEATQPMTWIFERSGRVVRALEGPIPDRSLRPIRPPKAPGLTKANAQPVLASASRAPTTEMNN